jgi:pyridoxine 5-phosphate synthase
LASDILDFVCVHRPQRATLVPEKREEVTTEGGLAVTGETSRLSEAIRRLHESEVEVSLFIDPHPDALLAAKELGVEWVEFHTGRYANLWAMLHSNLSRTHHSIPELELPRAELSRLLDEELENLAHQCRHAAGLHLHVAAGHGLNYQNVRPVAAIAEIEELNIGQSIIARSVFTGLEAAVREMVGLIR